MAIVAKPENQARAIVSSHIAFNTSKHNEDGTKKNDLVIRSVGTARTVTDSLKRVCEWQRAQPVGAYAGLKNITTEQAQKYLEYRRDEGLTQNQLNADKHSLRFLPNVDYAKIEAVKSVQQGDSLKDINRCYSDREIAQIQKAQSEKASFTTQIIKESGIRAHEVLTLKSIDERSPSNRNWHEARFNGLEKDRVSYTVIGKGGLIREVQLTKETSQKLEALKFEKPITVVDRGINYKGVAYDVLGGKSWSKSFSKASKSTLGFSKGGHGLRHTYARDRFATLKQSGLNESLAKHIVSHELGHFRASITDTYLR